MNNNEFQTIGLYDHNADSYKKIKSAFSAGKDVVGIVHATGTGKSYNALQLAYDNKDKKIVYIVPANGIIEHIKKIIEDNPNLDLKRDFPNLEFKTYQSFISLAEEEIARFDCDLLILDEFHHIGAPIWGARINTMIETHPEMKIFGMTAYTVRDRGTSYERDMTNPDTDELFSGKIESRYDLCDAMIDGVLPKPVYKSAYTNLIGLESKLEERVQKFDASSKEYQEYMSILSDAKRRIHEAPNIPNILKKSIKPNGKYIYFCPPCGEEGTNDIETIKKQALEWFKQFVPEKDIIFYTSTSDMGDDGKLNRDAFYADVTLDGEKVDDKLRVMFAINQYNEGIHAPNIDGVIMGRGTTSDIVYFEQLGRALSVRGNTKDMFEKLKKYSIEELTQMCKSKDISIKENSSKEDLIEKLIAPVVIDLTNNYEFIKKLENNLRDKIKDIQSNGLGNHKDVKIRDASFDIEIENQDLFEMLSYVKEKLTKTWEDYYELAKAYYVHNGNLLIPGKFKTIDGFTYDENGVALGTWIRTQRVSYSKMPKEKQQLLKNIDFMVNVYDEMWQKVYAYAKKYYEHHGNLLIPQGFKTNDGFTYDEKGTIGLGVWITRQRQNFANLSKEKQELLLKIGFALNSLEVKWQKKYNLAKKYYEYYGNLLIPKNFRTKDGITYDEDGVTLWAWISTQKDNYANLSKEKQQLLQRIAFGINTKDYLWNYNYNLAKKYYEQFGSLLIPKSFKTKDGITYDKNGVALGAWISTQRYNYANLSPERCQLLKAIGFSVNAIDSHWLEKYEYAKKYYEHYGNLNVPGKFKTNDGFTYDENGIALGAWIFKQRKIYFNLAKEKQELLQEIGFILNVNDYRWHHIYELAKKYYEQYGNLQVPQYFKTNDGITNTVDGEVNLGTWIGTQRYNFSNLSKEKQQLLQLIGFVTNIKKNKELIENVCLENNIQYDKNKNVLEHISIQELQSKIEFLKGNNLSIVDEEGLLTDIFSMSSVDMKEKYGISLEELISEYYVKNQKDKGI